MSGDARSAGWYERLVSNPHIEAVVIANDQGQILHSTRLLRSDQETLASMFQAMEVLAQVLVQEFRIGAARMIQVTTDSSHILLLPLAESTCFLVVEVARTAPLLLLMVELERVVAEVDPVDLAALQHMSIIEPPDSELDAAELIDAVQEWLRNRPTRDL